MEEMEKGLIDMNVFLNTDESGYNVVSLENSLFELGCIPNLIKGIFYMLPIFQQGKLFLR